MVFNATFNNISAMSWQSFLLMEETRVPEDIHRPAASHKRTSKCQYKTIMNEHYTHLSFFQSDKSC